MSRKNIIILAVFLALAATGASFAYILKNHNRLPSFPKQIIIYTNSGVSEEQVKSIATAVHAEFVQPANLPRGPAYLLNVPWANSADDTARVVKALRSYPDVKAVEENGIATTNDLLQEVHSKRP